MEETREITSVEALKLRISPNWGLLLFALFGIVMLFVSDNLDDPARRNAFISFGVLMYVGILLTFVVNRWQRAFKAWFVIGMAVVAILGAERWLGIAGVIVLLPIPVSLASVLIGLKAGAWVAVGETVYLLAVADPGPFGRQEIRLMTTILIWVIYGCFVAAYLPLYQVADWVRDYYARAQSRLDENRDRKAELEAALDELKNANRQLVINNRRIEGLREIAEQAQRTKTAFVASVSHEFRTPLNMIIGLVGLMVEHPEKYAVALSPKMRKDLEVVHRNSQHLSRMINDVLNLTQMEAGRMTLNRERIDLAEVVQASVQAVRPLFESKDVEMCLHLDPDVPSIYCDRTRISQVILNLISNAARYVETGRITVAIHPRGAQAVEVSVADTGPGIAPEDVERIFLPFYQGEQSLWRDRRGTGLGLAISKKFVELHGGRMWLESELGVGSTFSFLLPISAPMEPVAKPGYKIIEDWVWRERAYRTNRALSAEVLTRQRLIVYDETWGLYPQLEKYLDDVELLGARSLEDALDLLQSSPTHMVMLNTAGPDGVWDRVRQIQNVAPDTPILTSAVPQARPPALKSEAAGYLIKPILQQDLQGVLDAVEAPVRRVMICDDDPELLDLIEQMLGICDPTLEVIKMIDGRQALDVMRKEPCDILLLDLMMPHFDGWQVYEAMKADPTLAHVITYFVTAQDPVDEMPRSPFLFASIHGGIPLHKLLACSREVSTLLLKP